MILIQRFEDFPQEVFSLVDFFENSFAKAVAAWQSFGRARARRDASRRQPLQMGTDQLFCDSECVVSPWCRQSTPLCIPLTSTRLQLDQCEYCEMLDSAYFDTRTELLKERIDVARRLSDDAASDSKNSRNGAPSPENDNHRRGVGGEGGGPLNDENQRAPAEEAPDGFIFEMDSEEKEGRRNFPTLELDTSIVAPHSRRVTPLQATSASSVMIPEQHPHQAHSKLKLNTHLHHQVNIPSPSTISLKLG